MTDAARTVRRFYLRDLAAAAGSPADGSSNSRAMAGRLPAAQMFGSTGTVQQLARDPGAVGTDQTIALAVPALDASGGTAVDGLGFITAWVSEPLSEDVKMPAGRWLVAVPAEQSGSNYSAFLAACLYAWTPPVGETPASVRAYLWDSAQWLSTQASDDGFQRGRVFGIPAGPALIRAGDVIVLELWWRVEVAGGISGGNITLHYDGSDATIVERAEDADPFTPASYLEPPIPLPVGGPLVWSIAPDWSDGVTERIRFLTDVQETSGERELRVAVRTIPDRRLTLRHLTLDASRSARLEALLAAGQLGYWLPWWPDAVRLSAPVAAAAGSVPMDTAGRYMDDDRLLLWRDDDAWELVDVNGITAGAYTLAGGQPAATWPAGTWAIPLRRAGVDADPDLTRETSRIVRAEISFRARVVEEADDA
ncbi:MAG TPA: hypothetical protein VFK04_12990 [Gemmatimonadaceae bacterium]|nr:hypothetical protein [Gemmatimonadaceae bacterium]